MKILFNLKKISENEDFTVILNVGRPLSIVEVKNVLVKILSMMKYHFDVEELKLESFGNGFDNSSGVVSIDDDTKFYWNYAKYMEMSI